MKRTLSVNLGGSVYHIDEDAYQVLMDYLQDVKKHLTETSAEEVLNDIEQRISELFGQWMQGKREVITVPDVERVIGILGRPEQYDNEDESTDTTSEERQANKEERKATKEESHRRYEEHTPGPNRRLYRDTDNAVLGGVCSGVAAYLNVSVVLIRLILFFLIFFWFTGVLFYIAAWIIIPEARTAAQRLEMRGEDVTIENIEKKVREEAGKVKDRVDGYVKSNRFQENMRSAGNGFVEFIRVIVKVFMAIVGGAIGIAGFLVLLALIFGLLALWTGNLHFIDAWPHEFEPLQQALMNPSSATWMTFGLLLTIGIPFVALFRLLFSRLLNLKPSAPWEIWIGFIFWFIGIGLCIFSGLHLLSFCNGFWI
jgi:phage shock protein PspC (stress-responsive transcriptional regulator)